jgi:multiple sugar transport system permease protein
MSSHARITRRRHRSDLPAALCLIGPAVAGLAAFVIAPFVLATVWLSTHRIDLNDLNATEHRFKGLTYYRRLLDPGELGSIADKFYRALTNNLTFAVVVVIVQTALALGLAMALNRPGPVITGFRGLFFLPQVFPMVLVAVIWQFIYAPGDEGLLNATLGFLSGGHLAPQDWLQNEHLALLSIIILSIWQGVGFQMVVLLAGLQGIPRSLYEAAAVDRAGRWAQFRHVTLPGLRNTLIFVILTTTALALKLFDQVQILTPNNDHTRTIMSLGYDYRDSIGQAAAISVVFFLLLLVVNTIQRLVARQERQIR